MNERPGSCVRFTLGSDVFGLPLDQVREIALVDRIHPVPLAPPSVLGLLNLRGQVITLLDAALLTGRPAPPDTGPHGRLALVLSPPRQNLALYVHAPVEIGQARPEAVQQMAETASAGQGAGAAPGSGATLAAGAPVGIGGDVVTILSAADLADRVEERLVAGFRAGASS